MAIFNKTDENQSPKQDTPAKAAQTASHGVPGVLFGPRVSEKAAHSADRGKYVFNVAMSANKVTIKKAVENAYRVNVVQVNILNTKGKRRNFGRTSGTTSNFKKAVVTLKAGQKIEGATETI